LAKIGGSVVKKIDFKRLIPTGRFWGVQRKHFLC
jgi:hypothetical protein